MNDQEKERIIECTERAGINLLVAIAQQQARSAAVPENERQDCALAFIEFVLRRRRDTNNGLKRWFDGAYLTACARRHSLRYAKRLARFSIRTLPLDMAEVGRDSAGPHDDPYRVAEECDLIRRVIEAISKLARRDRQLFIRHHVFDQSLASISRDCGETSNALAQRLFRIRTRLRKWLHERQ